VNVVMNLRVLGNAGISGQAYNLSASQSFHGVSRLVGRLVGWSVGRSVGRSVGWSVGRLKRTK
jgi:hypothetical protein